MTKLTKRLVLLLGLALVVAGVFMGLNRLNASMTDDAHYYQRTKATNTVDGVINLKTYKQSELEQLTKITHGTKYTGNHSLDAVATRHVYKLGGKSIRNFVGSDGILQIHNESKMMTTPMVKDAAEFWNRVAGYDIVQVVDKPKASDEIIHDAKSQDKYIGGQQYDGTGMKFYPANWKKKGFTAAEDQINREAVLIRELGHALGIPTLGGGRTGGNAGAIGYITPEVMSVWETGPNMLPANRKGIRSTPMDAAAVALAGISWQHPRKLGAAVLKGQQVTVIYNSGQLSIK